VHILVNVARLSLKVLAHGGAIYLLAFPAIPSRYTCTFTRFFFSRYRHPIYKTNQSIGKKRHLRRHFPPFPTSCCVSKLQQVFTSPSTSASKNMDNMVGTHPESDFFLNPFPRMTQLQTGSYRNFIPLNVCLVGKLKKDGLSLTFKPWEKCQGVLHHVHHHVVKQCAGWSSLAQTQY